MLKNVILILLVSTSFNSKANMFEDKNTIFNVVVNHEEQYSIWPVNRENPKGWKNIGFSGTRNKCISHIEEIWTDMRPGELKQRIKDMQSKAGSTK